MIPRTIHQIWIGPKPAPRALMETWRRNHPEWEYRLWDESTIEFPLRNQAQFDAIRNLGGKADILRYEILHRHGGIYVDADLTSLKPLDDSFLAPPFFAVFENEQWRPGLIANGVLGAVPGHQVMEEMIDRIGGLDPEGLVDCCPAIETGPYALTDVLEAFGGNTKIFPSHWFYPEHMASPFSSPEYVYARHDWYSDFPTLALAMVVDRDSTDLWRSLPRFKPHIASYCIGVTDRNAVECREAIDEILGNIPGDLIEIAGEDRKEAWSVVLDGVGGRADYALVSETNAVLYDFRRALLTADAESYLIMDHCGSSQTLAVRMVRADGDWWKSQEWELPFPADRCGNKGVLLDECHMLRFDSLPAGPFRLRGEDEILLEALGRWPGDPEILFYLGQFYQDTGDFSSAIECYGRSSESDEWPLRRWEACWRVAHCHQLMEAPWSVIEEALTKAHRLAPERPEPLLELGLGFLRQKEFEMASDYLEKAASLPIPQRVFGHQGDVRQHALEQLNVSAFYAGRYQKGLRAGLEALQAAVTVLPREQIIDNLGYYLETMEIP